MLFNAAALNLLLYKTIFLMTETRCPSQFNDEDKNDDANLTCWLHVELLLLLVNVVRMCGE